MNKIKEFLLYCYNFVRLKYVSVKISLGIRYVKYLKNLYYAGCLTGDSTMLLLDRANNSVEKSYSWVQEHFNFE